MIIETGTAPILRISTQSDSPTFPSEPSLKYLGSSFQMLKTAGWGRTGYFFALFDQFLKVRRGGAVGIGDGGA